MDNLVKVYEEEGNKRIWLEDVLDDNGVPFKSEVESYWTGNKSPTFHEKVCVYVAEEHFETALGFIEEYNDEDNIAWEDTDGGSEMPQITCAACGRAFDFDYPKCPACNHPV